MSRSNKRRQRGASLTEMLTVSAMLGIFMTMGIAIVGPVLDAPNRLQSKVDTLQSAASGFYRLQRDVRMSDLGGDFACTTSGTITCTQSASTLTATNSLAVVTAMSGTTFQASSTTGKPTWQGVNVYWLGTDSSGATDLNRTYVAFASSIQAPSLPTAAQVQTAITTAVATSSPSMIMDSVSALDVDFNSTSKVLGFKVIVTGSEGGRTNESSFESDTFARN
jgi:hypothetical protein